jgi:hypothetical protein
MSTGLQLRQADEMNLAELQTLGAVFTKSGFFADTKDAAQAVVKVMAGMELGFPPIASMTGVYIVKGKVSLSANLMAAAIKRSGKYNYKVRELTAQAAEIEFFEGGESIGVSSFTMAEAREAKLHQDYKDNQWRDKATWKNFPRNMLFARAISNGAKWYCPDIFGGPIYTPDELGAEVDGETGEVIEIQTEAVERQAEALMETEREDFIEAEPEPVKTVKLEGAQPASGEWRGLELQGAAGHVVELAKKLKWDEGQLAQCVEAKFGMMIAPGKVGDYLTFATKEELRELYRAMNSQGGKK